MTRILVVLPVLLAITACAEEPAEAPADDQRGAEGEVLGGTISDAMLPLPTVRSQSPPLETAPANSATGEGSAEAGEQPAPSADPAAEPAEEVEAEDAPEEAED